MKTNQFYCAMAIVTLMFTSCQQDSLVSNDVNPSADRSTLGADVDFDVIKLISWQVLSLDKPDCPDYFTHFSNEIPDDQKSYIKGCVQEFGFEGPGQGYIPEYDRFTSYAKVEFDPDSRSFSGMLDFAFSSSPSTLKLKVEGPVKQTEVTAEDGTVLHVPLRYYSGTGKFANVDFTGVLKIMHADEIFDPVTSEYDATLLIEGEIITF